MITSVNELISKVKEDYSTWDSKTPPWFRGEPNDTPTPLLPRVYRPKDDDKKFDENLLLQQFRRKAPSYSLNNIPPRGNTDQWLFLAQHVGLPTRLLDWTEGLLIALLFALGEEEPVVWMLNPIKLNQKSVTEKIDDNVFPLTWFSSDRAPIKRDDLLQLVKFLKEGETKFEEDFPNHYFVKGFRENIGLKNIRDAWEKEALGTDFPVAIYPTYIHNRMSMQKSCFTIHGKLQCSINCLVDSSIIKKYVIDPDYAKEIRSDLNILGITNTSIFPDLDNLSKDLSELF